MVAAIILDVDDDDVGCKVDIGDLITDDDES